MQKLPYQLVVILALTAASILCAGDIKHKFVATDESGKQLLYVDETNPDNDWTIPLKGNRDVQLSGKGTVLVSVPTGYQEYSLKGGKLIKDIKMGSRIQSLVRLANGNTILASRNQVIELDKDDKIVATHNLELGGGFRLLRLAKSGNLLYVSGKSTMSERKRSGEVVRTLDLNTLVPKTVKPYSMEEMADGSFIISSGFSCTILHVDKDWKLIKSYGGRGKVEGVKTHFFADFQRLKNGNIVIAHWTGHSRKDSGKAPQAFAFDKAGKVVWTWHDPKRAGTFHGIEVIE